MDSEKRHELLEQMFSRPILYVLDSEHRPVPLDSSDRGNVLLWAREHEVLAKRIVAQTYVRRWWGTLWVSTVFLGIDHSFFMGPPLLFETMVFNLARRSIDWGGIDQSRYATWDEAENGHWMTVAMVRAHRVTFREVLSHWHALLSASWDQHLWNLRLPMRPEGTPRSFGEAMTGIINRTGGVQ